MNPMTDRDAIALTVYGECRGEPLMGQLAVAAVLMNRLRTGRWGSTYSAVALAAKQFSCWNANDPNLPQLQRLYGALTNWSLQEDVNADKALLRCLWIADGLLGGHFDSPVAGATHYYANSLKTPPAWAATGQLVAQIGSHKFFQGVP